MAPLQDFHSRDLAWISDFVREQLDFFLQPLMEHLQESDATVEYMQNAVRRLSLNVAEMEGELNNTSQCVTIMRKGLGVQSERRCALQMELDKAMEDVKQLEDQVGSLLSAFPAVEKQGQVLCADWEKFSAKQKETDSIFRSFEAGQANNTAHIEDCLRDIRRLQKLQFEPVPKLQFESVPQVEDHAAGFKSPSSSRQATKETWLQKKSFVAAPLDEQKYWETNGSSGHNSSYQQERLPRGGPPLRSNSCVAIRRVAEACETLAASVAATRAAEPEQPRRGPRLPPIT